MRTIKKLLSVICISLLLSVSGCTSVPGAAGLDKKLVSAKVTRVVDGDTIHVDYNGNEETVRFLLVDTPETHHPKLGVQPFGPEASRFTHKLLDGKTVQLELAVGGERDKYGRMLAYVYYNGQSVEEALLKKGLARVAYVYPPNTKHVEEYRVLQNKARKKEIGIWSVKKYAKQDGFHPEAVKSAETNPPDVSSGFAPDANGGCSGEIKGNISSSGGDKIYHIPTDRYYKVTKAESCYKTIKAAKADGFRAPK